MTCSRCNAPLPPGVTACPNCGLQFAQPVPGYGTPKKKTSPLLIGCLALLGILFILGVIGSMAGGGKSTTTAPSNQSAAPTTDATAPTSDNSTPNTPAPEPAIITVTASQLCSAYHKNQVSADDKYKDKLVKVTGTIGSIGKDITDTMYVTLNGTDEDLIGVQCMFDDQYKPKLSKLQKGDRVTITGTCDGSAIGVDIILKDSSI